MITFFVWVYCYCTDFVINVANLTGLSYYEVNFVLFIVVYPILLLFTTTSFVVEWFRYLIPKK